MITDRSADEAAVRAVEGAYDAAWRRADMAPLMACFAPDAVVVNPLGETAQGTGEIEAMLRAFLTGPGRGSNHTSRILRVSFVTEEVAVVDGEALLEGAAVDESVLLHRFTDILVKRGGAWVIAHVRAYLLSREGA